MPTTVDSHSKNKAPASPDFLERLKTLSAENGYDLVNTEWQGTSTKYQFRHCNTGRMYGWSAASLFAKGFPKDIRTNTDKLNALARKAQENGFVLMATEWGGIGAKHRFMNVKNGKTYTWSARQIMGEHGFPKTLGRQEGRLNELAKTATDNGFELLDTQWKGSHAKYRFKCMSTATLYAGAAAGVLSDGFPKYMAYLRACEQSLDVLPFASKSVARPQNIAVCTKSIDSLTMDEIANLFFDDASAVSSIRSGEGMPSEPADGVQGIFDSTSGSYGRG